MSLYRMVNGVSPAAFFVLPLLGQHPEEYPRFRDCFLEDEEHPEYAGKIHLYTRVGGGNRDSYEEEIEALQKMPGFVTDYDDSFDPTYATFVFEIPEEFRTDVALVLAGKPTETSARYKDVIVGTFPKIADKLREMLGMPAEAVAVS